MALMSGIEGAQETSSFTMRIPFLDVSNITTINKYQANHFFLSFYLAVLLTVRIWLVVLLSLFVTLIFLFYSHFLLSPRASHYQLVF